MIAPDPHDYDSYALGTIFNTCTLAELMEALMAPDDMRYWPIILPDVKHHKAYLAETQAIINQSAKLAYPVPRLRAVPAIRDNRLRVRLLSCRMTTRRDAKGVVE